MEKENSQKYLSGMDINDGTNIQIFQRKVLKLGSFQEHSSVFDIKLRLYENVNIRTTKILDCIKIQ